MHVTMASATARKGVRTAGFAGWVDLCGSGQGPDAPGLLRSSEGWLAFQGRLDDRAGLARRLGVADQVATPDAELVRLALAKWQDDALLHLLGDYAIAAWSEREKRLLLAADVAGLNTVYFWRSGDRVHVATCLRELLEQSAVPADLNEQYLVDCLAMNLTDNDATPYRSIRKVPAGSYVTITASRERTVAYHRYDPDRRLTLANDHEYVEAAWELLQQAVRDRLRGVDKVCILGSSGLDSASVAAATAAVSRKPFHFVTAIPDLALPTIPLHPTEKNEQHLVEVLAQAFPAMQATFVPPAADQNWDPAWLEPIQANLAPHRTAMSSAWFHSTFEMGAQLGASTYLGGAGGNLTLTWDGWRRLPARFRSGHFGEVGRELLLGCGGNPRRCAGLTWRELVRPLLGSRYNHRSLERYAGLRRSAVAEFDLLRRMQAAGNDLNFVRSLDSRLLRLHVIHQSRARRTELTNMHRAQYGLTHSTPLLDRRLTEFCLAIPEDQFLRDGNSRWLARRVLLGAGVPAAVAANRRFGYQHPEWFAHLTGSRPAMRAQVARLRSSPLANRLIDTERLDRILDAWPTDTVAAERRRGELGSVLAAGLAVGAFVFWAESGLRARRAAGAD
jgi:asparagine synthase (glutamine-hydrolysing)